MGAENILSIVREITSHTESTRWPHPEIPMLTAVGISAALLSGRIIRDFFNGITPGHLASLQIEWKEDATPRTKADVEGDLIIVETIRNLRPYDDIYIEESGYHKGVVDLHLGRNTGVIWDADSLDGTRPFVEGKPESTVGVGARDEKGNYLLGVIVHPFRKKLGIAIRGEGAYIVDLNEDLDIIGMPQRIKVNDRTSFAGQTVAVDSLYTPANAQRKTQLLQAIQARAFMDGGVVSHDEVGSNIAYELEVARGATILGITDAIPADKGTWDWRPGEALIREAGGIMVDPTTGRRPRNSSEVVIYGNPKIVKQILPEARAAYSGYEGFDSYSFEDWKKIHLYPTTSL